MNITKRLYTYPVLSEEKDDYDTTIFDVDINYLISGVNTLKIVFNITMNNSELNNLIIKQDAEYIIHIECANTSYRRIIRTTLNEEIIEIPTGKINGRLEIIGCLVAKKDLVNFNNYDWNKDYEGITFNLSKGSILAYKNIAVIDIFKNYEELANSNSIFKICKRITEESKPLEVNLESEYICVFLSTSEYENYVQFSKNMKLQPLLNSMIIFPTLVYVFEELKQEDGIEEYEGKKWFVSLKKSYQKRGLDFIDEIQNEEKTSIQLAQEAMELPLTSALNNLNELFGESEEEES